MGRFEEKKKKTPVRTVVLVAAVLVLVVMAAVLWKMCGTGGTETVVSPTVVTDPTDIISEEPTEAATTQVQGVSFPLLLDESLLTLESLFQFDGFNPDCENQTGNDIASLLVRNTSGSYLERADITLETDDGKNLVFAVTELPAGKAVMVFAQDNAPSDAADICVNVSCDASFADSASMYEDRIGVSVMGTLITLQNNTDESIPELTVYCHSSLGEELFGGITYQYTVNDLGGRGTATVDALDCILGLTEVVRISIPEA